MSGLNTLSRAVSSGSGNNFFTVIIYERANDPSWEQSLQDMLTRLLNFFVVIYKLDKYTC